MYFKFCLAACLQNGDVASPSISLAGQALLVKMLITLELHGAFGSKFACLCILTFLATGDEASRSIIFAGRPLK